jgi:hypothetical protein
MIGTLTQGHHVPMMTPAAILRCIGRVDFDSRSSSFFRFGEQLLKKSCPCRIMNAFCKTMIVNHTVHVKVFHADQAKPVYDLPTLLMSEVVTPELDTLVYPGYYLAMFPSLRGTFDKLRMRTIDFGKGFFLFPEKARVLNFFAIAQRGEGLQAYINTHLSWSRFKSFGFALAREGDRPLAGRGTVHATGFDFALQGTVVDHLDTANLGKGHTVIMGNGKTRLGKGERVVAVRSTKTGIAGLLTCFDSTEECFESQVNTYRHVLKDLRMNTTQGGTFVFQNRESVLLLKTGERKTVLVIGRLAHLHQVVIEPTTLFKGLVQLLFLLFCWIDAVLQHFQHSRIVSQTKQDCKRETAPHLPQTRSAAFTPIDQSPGLSAAVAGNVSIVPLIC